MAGQEAVDERERRAHPARERLVLGVALQRIDPDDRVRGASELRHLACDELVVLALPAVGDDDDHRAAGERTPPVDVVELLERRADARPAPPVHGDLVRPRERSLWVTGREIAREPREPRAERERLHPAPVPTIACRKSRSARAYESIEPETSQRTTSFRGTALRAFHA